jgi:uncharacterized membrane protein YfcA
MYAQMSLALGLATAVGVVLGLLGAGGSILGVPILIFFAHVDPRSAVVASLVIVGATSLVAALQHARSGRVRLSVALWFAATGMPAAWLGGRISRGLTPRLTMFVFAGVMVASALGMLFRSERPPAERQALGQMLAVGFGVGLVTGFVGAGGGFLIVPALVLFAGVPMRDAVGTSLVTIALNCTAGLAGKWDSAPVDWRLTLSFTACAVAGSFIGLALSKRVSAQSLRRTFAVLVLAVAAAMFAQALRSQ